MSCTWVWVPLTMKGEWVKVFVFPWIHFFYSFDMVYFNMPTKVHSTASLFGTPSLNQCSLINFFIYLFFLFIYFFLLFLFVFLFFLNNWPKRLSTRNVIALHNLQGCIQIISDSTSKWDWTCNALSAKINKKIKMCRLEIMTTILRLRGFYLNILSKHVSRLKHSLFTADTSESTPSKC